MSTNKHAQLRYLALDKCLSNFGRKFFIEDLIEACNQKIQAEYGNKEGVQRRQVYEDIKFMKSIDGLDLPIETIRDGRRTYYRYADKNVSYLKKPLTTTEENQLKSVLVTLSKFKGLPQFEWIEETMARLDAELGLTLYDGKVIEFDQNLDLTGLKLISPIYDALTNRQTLKISYKNFKITTKQTFTLHPYFLKQYNNRWFLYGLNEDSGQITNLALDRIIDLKESKIKFKPNETIDFNEYFYDVIGVTVKQDIEKQKVELEVRETLLPYIKTKPLHPSQKVKKGNENNHIIIIEVIPNYELEALLLSFGEGLKVLKPMELKEKLAKRIREMNNSYQ